MRVLALLMMSMLAAAGSVAAQEEGGDTSADASTDTSTSTDASTSTSTSTSTDTSTSTSTSTDASADTGAGTGAGTGTDEDDDDSDDSDDSDEAGDADEADEADEGDLELPTARWSDERVIGWATIAASMAVAITGGVILAVGLDDINSVENAPDGTMWATVEGARDRAPILTGLGAAVLGLGAAGVAVGAGLLAYFGNEGTWISVSILPNGVSASGRF